MQETVQKTFQDYQEYGISFSQNSVTGIINWLEAMEPPCIIQTSSGSKTFARRAFCSSELVLLALEYARVKVSTSQISQLQLSNEVCRIVAHLCLVEEEVLDELFQITADAFGLILRQTERGNWISLLGDRSPLPLKAWFSVPSSTSAS